MLEISTSGLMSGDGKRSGALQSTATAPVLDSTRREGNADRRGQVHCLYRLAINYNLY
jgi:hypothetical protein